MQSKLRTAPVLVIWLLLVLTGVGIYHLVYTPTQPFIGYWNGQTTIHYGDKRVLTTIQLIVDDAYSEKARIIANFEPQSDYPDYFQTNFSANIQVFKRTDNELTLSISNPFYTNKDELETYLKRQLPLKGTLITANSWSINQDEVFLLITLAFGEKMGVILKRHE